LAETPVADAVTAVATAPVTPDGVAVTVITPLETAASVLYIKDTEVAKPLAFTEPFITALNEEIPVAASVVAVGGTGALTVADVVFVPVAVQLPASLAVSVYMPVAAAVAAVITGFAIVDVNEFGPAHE
jgi:hypothetical protein